MIRRNSMASRGLLLGMFAAVAGLVWLAVVDPLAQWRRQTAEAVVQAQTDIARLNDSLASLTAARASLVDDRTAGMVWTARQTGEAEAMVQSRLSELAQTNGLALRSIAPLPAREVGLANAVGFRMELEAPLDALIGFLLAVEQTAPILGLERATLRRLIRPGEVGPVAGAGQPVLFVQLDILAPVQIGDPAKDET